jgi:transcriptional regulator with XRE-family HTH domain
MNIIKELKKYMEDNELTQRQLATFLDTNETYLSRLLNNNANPGAKIYKSYFNLPGIMEKEYQEKRIRDLEERIKNLEADREYFENAIDDIEQKIYS